MLDTQLAKMTSWFADAGSEASVAVCSQCSLIRNLADFAFPATCLDEDNRAVRERVVGALGQSLASERGEYRSLSMLTVNECRILAERRLIPAHMLLCRVHGGVFLSEDQSLSVCVNGQDHICMTSSGPGLHVKESWSRLSAVDDLLARSLDYAFSKRFGYLTSSLRHVGTGLKASVVLHLPALAMAGALGTASGVGAVVSLAAEKGHVLYGLLPVTGAAGTPPSTEEAGTGSKSAGQPEEYPPDEGLYYDLSEALYGEAKEGHDDFFLLTNRACLGIAEAEVVFNLCQTVQDIVALEKRAREFLLERDRIRLEDRVSRALGMARSARLMTFSEAMALVSSVRLGVETNLVHGYGLAQLNELLFSSQTAHLRARLGRDSDDRAVAIERADLFRARFSQHGKDN